MENFVSIKGFEGRYSISISGKIKNDITGYILNPCSLKSGYNSVKFRVDKNKYKDFYIHRLIAIHFIPNPENKKEVNHINGNRHDNRIENLEWVTKSENALHAYRIGLNYSNPKKGEDWYAANVTNEIVLDIRKMYSEGYRNKDICEKYNLLKSQVSSIAKRRTWKHI